MKRLRHATMTTSTICGTGDKSNRVATVAPNATPQLMAIELRANIGRLYFEVLLYRSTRKLEYAKDERTKNPNNMPPKSCSRMLAVELMEYGIINRYDNALPAKAGEIPRGVGLKKMSSNGNESSTPTNMKAAKILIAGRVSNALSSDHCRAKI